MKLSKIQRIKNLDDVDIPTFAVKVNNKYILVYRDCYPKIYRKLEQIYEDTAFKYIRLKNIIKNTENVKTKEELFKELLIMSDFIGL